MPTYDYECQACGHTFERFQEMSANKLRTCPECGKKKLIRLVGAGAGVIFKGSGFYETDYKRANASATTKNGTGSEGSKDASKSTSSSESSSDAKSASTKTEKAKSDGSSSGASKGSSGSKSSSGSEGK